MKILPILTNRNQEIPDSPTGEIYPIYIWLDLMQGEVWAEADMDGLAYKNPNIYCWEIPLMSDANTMALMRGLRCEFEVMIGNHIPEFPLPSETEEGDAQWVLNAVGTQAKCDIDRYLKQFSSFIN